MPKPRGREHSTLTETATLVVSELTKISGIKMIAPGTTAGFELIISGQSTQKVAVHTTVDPRAIFATLKASKKLREFVFKERERRPGE